MDFGRSLNGWPVRAGPVRTAVIWIRSWRFGEHASVVTYLRGGLGQNGKGKVAVLSRGVHRLLSLSGWIVRL